MLGTWKSLFVTKYAYTKSPSTEIEPISDENTKGIETSSGGGSSWVLAS